MNLNFNAEKLKDGIKRLIMQEVTEEERQDYSMSLLFLSRSVFSVVKILTEPFYPQGGYAVSSYFQTFTLLVVDKVDTVLYNTFYEQM